MSNTTATGTPDQPPAAGPKKSRKMLLIIIISIVVLGAGGGGGYFYFNRGAADAKEASGKEAKGHEEEATEKDARAEKTKKKHAEEDEGGETEHDAEAEEEEEEEEPPVKKSSSKSLALSLPKDGAVKHVIELQPYVVNLADQGEARYLRLTVSVGIGGEEGESAEAEKPSPLFTTRVRNAMLAVLATKTSEEVLTAEGKVKLRKELLQAARAASKEPKVEAIYITEFIVQL